MGTALIQLKIMPESPETNLDELQSEIEKTIKENNGNNPKFEIKPVAFGLNSITASFSMDESFPTDPFETEVSKIKGVNSAEITDFRRAFG